MFSIALVIALYQHIMLFMLMHGAYVHRAAFVVENSIKVIYDEYIYVDNVDINIYLQRLLTIVPYSATK